MNSPRFHPLVRLVLSTVICLVVVIGLQALAILVLMATNVVAMPSSGAMFPTLTPRLTIILMMMGPLATVAGILFCRRILDNRSLLSLGLQRHRAPGHFLAGAVCGVLALTFICGVLWLCGVVVVDGLSPRALEVGTGGVAGRLLFWAALMLCVGFSEEISFRGYALHNLGAWLGSDKVALGASVIIQAIVFGLIHMANFGRDANAEQIASAWQAFPNLVLVAIFFALCALKTGSLWFPIGFHAAWNFFLGSVFSLPVSGLATFKLLNVRIEGSHWLTGGPFGIEGSILSTIILAALIYVVRHSEDAPQIIVAIQGLKPEPEPEDEEVDSRAPGLRQRKEKRRLQTTTQTSFEGWNDLAPARPVRYQAYRPQFPTPEGAFPVASAPPVATPPPDPSTFPAAAFAKDATPPAPPVIPDLAPFPTDAFAEVPVREAPAPPVPPMRPAPPSVMPTMDLKPLEPAPSATPTTPPGPAMPPGATPTPSPAASSIPVSPATPTPGATPGAPSTEPAPPPAPPVKKPPAPRW